MFSVRPVLRHFVVWLVLAPVFLVEAYALREFLQMLALQDVNRAAITQAHVVQWRSGADGPEVRYQFQVADRPQTYTATSMNVLGGALWVPISSAAWQRAQQNGKNIEVIYLRNNPWVNQPTARIGSPLSDSLLAWAVFLTIDLLWIAETAWIARNYVVCQAAAERREAQQMRFWRSVPTK